MESCFQMKMVGYQDKGMKREIQRVVRRQLGTSSLQDWAARAARFFAIALFVIFFIYTILFIVSIFFLSVSGWMGYTIALCAITVALAVIMLSIRKQSDPLRENLWPPEAPVVTVSFGEESFQTDEIYFSCRVEYRTVQAVFETNSAFYLFVRDEHVLMLRKRDFIQGEPERFRDFITEKTGQPVQYLK